MPASESIASRTGACQRCHRRKVRCDRTRPSCTPCARISAPCMYAAREHQVQLRRQDVERLEQRIRHLEVRNDSLNSELAEARNFHSRDQASSQTPPASTHNASSHTVHPTNDKFATPASSLLGLGLHQSNAEPGAPSGSGEIANQVIHLSLSAGGGRNFVGSTSGLFLANLLQPHGQPSAPSLPPGQPPNPAPGRTGQRVTASSLPPKSLASEIIDAYCNHDRLHYPLLAPKCLERALDNVYRAADDHEDQALESFDAFLVHMTLAIGTAQVYKLNWNGIWDAEVSYNRASAHLADVLAQGGRPALQALLLVCQYRMGTPSHDTTASVWHLIGVAARMCFELGLHRSSTYSLPKTGEGQAARSEADLEARREDIETKRRCFWSVVAMDRIASLVLGRPLAIQLDDIEVDLPTIDLAGSRGMVSSTILLSNHSLSTAAYGTTEWQLSTSIFVHIVRYRIICGKILNALHRTTGTARGSSVNYEAVRDNLAAELREWHANTSSLPLVPADAVPASPAGRSSFRSQEWYDLLYHNGILMLFRPSPCLCDASRNSTALHHVFDSSQKSLNLYATLHRTGRINYSWVTLHSVFIAGLSYIYALRNHLQHAQSQGQAQNHNPGSARASLAMTPSINQVVNDTRACSKVLVAVSERWAVARNCSEVFDKLSDAVVADVVESQMGDAATTLTTSVPLNHGANPGLAATPSATNLSDAAFGQPQMPGFVNMTVDNTLRDCFGDLQTICYDQYHSDAIVQLSQDWLFGLGENPERYL